MRRPTTDGGSDGQLAARVAVIEDGLTAVRADLDATQRTIESIAGALTSLGDNEQTNRPGQRDWLTVTDPTKAREWIASLDEWLSAGPGAHLGLRLTPCWPLHPDTVADLLALQALRGEAYHPKTGSPTAVADILARWAPDTRARINKTLKQCHDGPGHVAAGQRWDCTRMHHHEAAAWWAIDRDRCPAVHALQLDPAT